MIRQIKKNSSPPLQGIKGLLQFAANKYFKHVSVGNLYNLPGIHSRDLKTLIPEGHAFCLCCGKPIRPEEIGFLVILEGRYQFCCRSILCREYLTDTL